MDIKVLDCTLRDGGYINNWEFGKDNIKKIMSKLVEAKIDIIECGYLTEKALYSGDYSMFNNVDEINEMLPKNRDNTDFVAMINYGEYNLDNLPIYDGSSVNGFRVTFHKKEMSEAIEFCEKIMKKGYKLYLQPMVSVSYTDVEFLNLIEAANKLNPHAFYIVDSFGVMKRKDLMRLYYLVDHNLNEDVYVGYHSHNNLQLAYSNAQSLVDMKIKRKLIIDSSVFGMGRGAGNLNTELFIEYLNDNIGSEYKQKPLLQIIDQVLNNIYLNNYWGYSLPHYISANHNCHPNYASYLADKNTLKVEDISNILAYIDDSKKNNFNKMYIETLYAKYQENDTFDVNVRQRLTKIFENKVVVVIAPGRSVKCEIDKINKEISLPNTIVISINFKPKAINSDYIFISNLRRYEELKDNLSDNVIVSSNINPKKTNYYIIDYNSLLSSVEEVEDNAGLMLIKLLISLGVKSIKLAGYDGYSYDAKTNYTNESMAFVKKNDMVDDLNSGMAKVLGEFSNQASIEFITESKYDKNRSYIK